MSTTGLGGREVIGAAAARANGTVEHLVRGAAVELPRGLRITPESATALLGGGSDHLPLPDFVPDPALTRGRAPGGR